MLTGGAAGDRAAAEDRSLRNGRPAPPAPLTSQQMYVVMGRLTGTP
ncbi:hypothetical protein [Streptomyces cuspidosporus]